MYKLLFPIDNSENKDMIIRNDLFPSDYENISKLQWEKFLLVYLKDSSSKHFLRAPYHGDFFIITKKSKNNTDVNLGVFHIPFFMDLSGSLGIPLPNALIWKIDASKSKEVLDGLFQKVKTYHNIVKDELGSYKSLKLNEIFNSDELLINWATKEIDEKVKLKSVFLERGTPIVGFEKSVSFSFVYIPYKSESHRNSNNLNLKGGYYWFDNYNLFEFLDNLKLIDYWKGKQEKENTSQFQAKLNIWGESNLKNNLSLHFNKSRVSLHNAPYVKVSVADNKIHYKNTLQFPFFYCLENRTTSVLSSGQEWKVKANSKDSNHTEVSILNILEGLDITTSQSYEGKEFDDKSKTTLKVTIDNLASKKSLEIEKPENRHNLFITNKTKFKFKIQAYTNKSLRESIGKYWKAFFAFENWSKTNQNESKLSLFFTVKSMRNQFQNSTKIPYERGKKFRDSQELLAKFDKHINEIKLNEFEKTYLEYKEKIDKAYDTITQNFDYGFVRRILDENCPDSYKKLFLAAIDIIRKREVGKNKIDDMFGEFHLNKQNSSSIISFEECKNLWAIVKESDALILSQLLSISLGRKMSESREYIKFLNNLINSDTINPKTGFNDLITVAVGNKLEALTMAQKQIEEIHGYTVPIKKISKTYKLSRIEYEDFVLDEDFIPSSKIYKQDIAIHKECMKHFSTTIDFAFSVISTIDFLKNPSFSKGTSLIVDYAQFFEAMVNIHGEFYMGTKTVNVYQKSLTFTIKSVSVVLAGLTLINAISEVNRLVKDGNTVAAVITGYSLVPNMISILLPLGASNPALAISLLIAGLLTSMLASYFTDDEFEIDIKSLYFGNTYQNVESRKFWNGKIKYQTASINNYFRPIEKWGDKNFLQTDLVENTIEFSLNGNYFSEGSLVLCQFEYFPHSYTTVGQGGGEIEVTYEKEMHIGLFGFYAFSTQNKMKNIQIFEESDNGIRFLEKGKYKIVYENKISQLPFSVDKKEEANYLIKIIKPLTKVSTIKETGNPRRILTTKIRSAKILVTHNRKSVESKELLPQYLSWFYKLDDATAIQI